MRQQKRCGLQATLTNAAYNQKDHQEDQQYHGGDNPPEPLLYKAGKAENVPALSGPTWLSGLGVNAGLGGLTLLPMGAARSPRFRGAGAIG